MDRVEISSPPGEALEFASRLAQQAGELLSNYYQRPDLVSSLKTDRTLVSEADLAADNLIKNALQQRYPDQVLISEETNSTLQPGGQQDELQYTWVIDPLDGTTNFCLGLHTWGVLITRCCNGWPELAVLHFPLLNELYTARRNHGAWLNEKPLNSRAKQDRPITFFACCSRTHRHYQVNVPFKARILGSAAYSFCMVARGAAAIAFESRTKIWDIAGAWLLVTEAGGSIELIDYSLPFPLQVDKSYDRQSYACLSAVSQDMLAKARRWIQANPI